ncbi:FAD dependent oxidoreductase-domain-containing protein [Colletotrichum godetiae]|uniref:FAD dependent oxidoreductase-domain-containing protein n=1 Tax=Colletotrichum godetiae TaxID=1209918 RepID=A0AAJ0AJU9_9PEZI|nr:FAD dependent oxidoreductase-domain-containing protein [Colletotrichum godetiae]KAK1675207.1 FAD dependent oxidoreductase-domain-containing protein [Colletotrichum godetiae]
MRFLVTTTVLSIRGGTKKSTYISQHDPHSDLSAPFSSDDEVDVWICDGSEVTSDLMDQWVDHDSHNPKSMLVQDAKTIPRLREHARGRLLQIAAFPEHMEGLSKKEWEEAVLREAEMLYAKARADADTQRIHASIEAEGSSPSQTNVLLIGAGIMNLVAAQLLARRGYKICVVDQGPDPRACQLKDWTALGVTSGGHNARMFTNTEADNYNEQDSEIYQDMQSIFRKTVRGGGWSVKSPEDFNTAENDWVSAFERVPGWMAAYFKKNIHEVNVESGKLWRELMKKEPHLFEEVGLHEDIIRLYVEDVALEASVSLNQNLGALLEAPSTKEFLETYPVFRPAAERDHLAGGIIVDGFTVNIHLFMNKLINHISDLGAEFIWDCEVQAIQRNSAGEVIGLKSKKGDLKADHFILSPGTTGSVLLHGTASENLIQGVLGIWLQIPNLNPKMRNSMKIHRRGHKVEDINVTVAKDRETGEDILVFGGAYGYVGLGRPDPDSPEMKALYDELEEVARIYFPEGYAAAKSRGPDAMYPGGHRKYCVRPFTPTGLGVFERIPTVGGGQLIITGGNNTGGFAQAPGMARAILRSLLGENDPVHILFHPDRGKLPPAVNYRSRTPSPGPTLASPDTQKTSLRLLLVCSDGPQHRYLRYRLDQEFPGYRCVQETSDGQVRQLMNKGRVVDACWQQYHGLRRGFFGHDVRRAAHFDKLVPQGHVSPAPDLVVDSVNCRAVWDATEKWQPELTIVSGTKYIGKKLMARAGLMINMHTGHLPEYKGNHCIFFALYDGAVDRVASTLHQLTPELDGGDVLDRVFPKIDPDDNEDTLYTKCLEKSIDRCVEHIGLFSKGKRLEFVAQQAGGRTFRHRDRTPGKELALWWSLKAGGLLKSGPASKGVDIN